MAEQAPKVQRIDLEYLDRAAKALEKGKGFDLSLNGEQTSTIAQQVIKQLVEAKLPFPNIKQEMEVRMTSDGAQFSGNVEIHSTGMLAAKLGLSFALENDPDSRLHNIGNRIRLAGEGDDKVQGRVDFTQFKLGHVARAILSVSNTSLSDEDIKALIVSTLRNPNQAFLDVIRDQMKVRGQEVGGVGLQFVDGNLNVHILAPQSAAQAA